MTRTIRRGADAVAAASAAEGVERGSRDALNSHEGGARASGRATPSLAPVGATATRPRAIVLGQFAVSDDRMVKVTINPNGKASTVEVRMYSRSGGIYFPTADGLVLPIQAAAFIGGHLRDIKKTIKKLQEAGL